MLEVVERPTKPQGKRSISDSLPEVIFAKDGGRESLIGGWEKNIIIWGLESDKPGFESLL